MKLDVRVHDLGILKQKLLVTKIKSLGFNCV